MAHRCPCLQVYKVEAVGSQSGKPSKKVTIVKSGELPVEEATAEL